MKVLIVGAGFGGLALAAYLQRDGHQVTIIEKSKAPRQAGFVIGLWSNGLHTLEPFGISERLQQLGMPVTHEFLRDKSGSVIAKMNYQSLINTYGNVFLLLHTELHQLLRELIVDIPLYFDTMIQTLELKEQTVSVTLSNGTQTDFDLVVGADGTHSQVRNLLFGEQGFSSSGLRIWVTMLSVDKEPPAEPNDLFGEGEYVGIFPTKYAKIGVLFLAARATQKPDLPEERIGLLRERFNDFGWMVPDILQSLHDPREIFSDDIDQVSLESWSKGRVVLMGDAAHALSPTTAMGGAMALEDAHVLAEELHQIDSKDVELALARYFARRKPRIEEIRHTSDFLIWLTSMRNPAMTLMRNTIMHLLPSSLLLQGMETILETQA